MFQMKSYGQYIAKTVNLKNIANIIKNERSNEWVGNSDIVHPLTLFNV